MIRHLFVIATLAALRGTSRPTRGHLQGDHWRPTLSAAGKRRQNLNLYGFGQLPFEILPMRGPSIDQDRTRLDHPVETRIGPFLARNSEGVGNRSGIDVFLADACSRPGPCPVMKGNGHHCVTLKHASGHLSVG